ncbi:MAG: cell envelope integrity protein TolA [Glaciimonas sp.]|nr:cell envelope integrity protein TolA [Glaciimonas sp.]
MNESTPYSVPHEPGRWRAFALAAVVHVALFAFLWFGIRWQNEKPHTVEAEIWSPSTQQAAPVTAQKIPEPQPEPPIEKTPEKILEKPLPVPLPEPRPAVATPPVAKPDIALEQEKKRKVRQEQQKREQEQERLAQKRLEEERLNEKLAQKEKAALKQKEVQKEMEALKQKEAQKEKLAAQAEKEKVQAQKKREAEDAIKIAAAAQEKKRKQELAKQAATAVENAKVDKQREENLRRMAGNTSGSGGAGTAAKSQGNRGDPGYGDRIKGKIKSNTIFNVPSGLNGNPAAVYEVNLLPDGTIQSLKLQKPSGVAGFDEAVKRGIEKSEPFPKDKSGQVPSSFELTYKPKD